MSNKSERTKQYHESIINLPRTKDEALHKLLSLKNSQALSELRNLAQVMERNLKDGIVKFHSGYKSFQLSKIRNVLLVFTFCVDGEIDIDSSAWISDINPKTYLIYHSKSKIICERSLEVGYKSHGSTSFGPNSETESIFPDIDCELYQPTGSVGQQLRSDGDFDEFKELKRNGFVYQTCFSFSSPVRYVECNIVMSLIEFIKTFKNVTGYNPEFTLDNLRLKLSNRVNDIKEKLPKSREEILNGLSEDLRNVCKQIKDSSKDSKLFANNLTHGRIHEVIELQKIGITFPYYLRNVKKISDMKGAVQEWSIPRPDLGNTPYIISFNNDSQNLRIKYVLCPVNILLEKESRHIRVNNENTSKVLSRIDEPLTLSDLHYDLIITPEEWIELLEKKILLQVKVGRSENPIYYYEQTIIFTIDEFLQHNW